MIKIVEGNLLDATEDIIGHQVNCQGVMGSGVAKQIREKYPIVFDDYRAKYERNINFSRDLLGKCQFVRTNDDLIVANLFGQYNYGRDKSIVYTDYISLGIALRTLEEMAAMSKLSVALPYFIGCGYANGDWHVVSALIEQIFSRSAVTLYKYSV